MKRFYCTVFLVLFLLNISGYYVVFLIAEYEITKKVASKIEQTDDNINGNMILKMPMKLPYPPGSNDYERISGEVEYEGELYHLVKQRFYQDTLYIVCIKDYQTKEIREAIGDCVKTFTDQPAPSSSSLKIINAFVKDYLPTFCSLQHSHNGWIVTIDNFSAFEDRYAFTHTSIIFHPPSAA